MNDKKIIKENKLKLKFSLIILSCFIILTPIFGYTQEILNAGIVKGLWFSEKNIFANDKIVINTIIRNDSEFDISSTIVFYDNSIDFYNQQILINKKSFKHIKTDYIISEGQHNFTAKLIKTKKIEDGQETEDVKMLDSVLDLGSKNIFVDLDTDNDNIGNREDEDDDGDGYSDEIEKKHKTNPLDKNSTPELAVLKEKKVKEKEDKKLLNRVTQKTIDVFDNFNLARENIAINLNKKIQARKEIDKLENNKLILNKENKIEENKNNKNSQEKSQEILKIKSNFYTLFLEFLYRIFNSLFLSILFLILIVWIIFKIVKKIILK